MFNRKVSKSLTTKLPYWDTLDDVMFLRSGQVEAGLKMSLLPELSDLSLGRLSGMLKATLRSTPPGSRIRFVTDIGPCDETMLRDYCRLTTATEPAASRMTASRYTFLESLRRQGALTRWDATVSLCTRPEFESKKQRAALAELEVSDKVAMIKRVCGSVSRYLAQLGVNPTMMSTQDIYETVYRYLNPSDAHVVLPTYVPTTNRYPSSLVTALEGLRPGTFRARVARSTVNNKKAGHLIVGEHYLKMIALYTEPDEAFPTMGNLLLGAGTHCTVVVEMTHEEQGETIRGVKSVNQRNGAGSGVQGMYQDSDADENLSQGRELLRYLTRTGDHMYQVSALVILKSRNLEELEYLTDQAHSRLARIPGAPFRVLRQGLKAPWLAAAPFNGLRYEEYASLVETHASWTVPFNGPWSGSAEPVALFHTRHNTLVSLDPFDPRNKNPHALFLGETRSGKTFTAQYLATEAMRKEELDLRVIDRGLGWKRVVEAFGGAVIPIEAGGSVSINPFELPEGETRPSGEHKAYLLSLLRAMLPAENKEKEGEEDAILTYTLQEVYTTAVNRKPAVVNGERVWEETFTPFRLSNYKRALLTLSAIGDQPLSAREREIATSLARRLEVWCGDTPLGQFIDRPTSLPTVNTRAVLYETSSFDKQPRLDAVGTMMIQWEIWKQATRHKQRRMILATDEAWAVLENEHSSKFMVETARRGAKEGIALWILTHSMEDVGGEGKAGLLMMSNYYLFRVTGEEDLIARNLKLTPNLMSEYATITGEKGRFNEFCHFTRRESGDEADILRLITCPEDYWRMTNHADDLARLEQETERTGSEEAAIQYLAQGA